MAAVAVAGVLSLVAVSYAQQPGTPLPAQPGTSPMAGPTGGPGTMMGPGMMGPGMMTGMRQQMMGMMQQMGGMMQQLGEAMASGQVTPEQAKQMGALLSEMGDLMADATAMRGGPMGPGMSGARPGPGGTMPDMATMMARMSELQKRMSELMRAPQ
ncbi:MAG TPA: hypothetical protein VF406_05225 [Thermodesulfobacteriota bacterium]